MQTVIEAIKKFFAWLIEYLQAQPEKPIPIPEPKPQDPAPTDPSAPAVPKLPIQMGASGEAVTLIQKRLLELKYSLDVDGEFGEETKAQVIRFQVANKIGTTGVVGEQTYKALFSAEAKGPLLGARAAFVEAAQLALEEGRKNLHWDGQSSEAEKYLASVRKAIGMPSGRFAWCGAFVYWCLRQKSAGIPVQIGGGTVAYVPSWLTWARQNKYWHPATEQSFNPEKGDLVLFDFDDDGVPDHIGFVVGYSGGSVVTTAEGNTSSESDGNGNQTAMRSRQWDVIQGFIRVV